MATDELIQFGRENKTASRVAFGYAAREFTYSVSRLPQPWTTHLFKIKELV